MSAQEDFERAAKAKRERDDQQRADQGRELEERDLRSVKKRLDIRRDVFVRSMTGGNNVPSIFIGASLIGGAGAAFAIVQRFKLSGWAEDAAIAGCSVVVLAVAFMVPVAVTGILADLRLGRLANVAPGFDVARYREDLSENRGNSRLIVRVELKGTWSGNRDDVPDAVLVWVDALDTVRWDSDALVLTSKEIRPRQYVSARGGAWNDFYNGELHACFVRIARQVLPKLAAVTPIARIDVTIDGPIEPWDAPTSVFGRRKSES